MTSLPQPQTPDYMQARVNMIESQIRPNKVRDEAILTAMETIPREMFVPSSMAGIAYMDEDLKVGEGRYLLEPMVLARMLQEVGIKADDVVLDIAPTTGYSTAVLASIVQKVTAVEKDLTLTARASSNLAHLGFKNAAVYTGDMSKGYANAAPYDVILINGAVSRVPDEVYAQLAERGRLVCVVMPADPTGFAHAANVRLFEKIDGKISSRSLFDAKAKLVPGFETTPVFQF